MTEKIAIETIKEKLILDNTANENEEKEQRILGVPLTTNEKLIFSAIGEINKKLIKIEAKLLSIN